MILPPIKKRNFVKKILDKRRALITSDAMSSRQALHLLNISQFLGVINDNIFKFLTVFLLIDLKGLAASSSILFWVGTVYVLPFLFFSSAAGILADKISKQKIIVFLKGVEVLITGLAVLAFSLKSPLACYTLLFLLSFHSAAFGPPKYSIIPELVPSEKISKANGLITSFTYLGIIIGTFLASFSTQITGKNFTLCALLCVVIALMGFTASLFIPRTAPLKTNKKIKFFFLKEIYQTLRFCYKTPHLLIAVLSSMFFLYLGAFFQLNIIPFAMEALHLSEVGGGWLFLTVAIGIAAGAVCVGKLSKHHVELGFACISGVFIFLFMFLLSILPKTLLTTLILLILVGFCSGFFIVPFDAYIQKFSPNEQRGQIVATSNFMSFCGVLLAPFSLYLFSGALHMSSSQGFFAVSIIAMFVSLFVIFSLSQVLFYFVGRKLLSAVFKVYMQSSPFEDKQYHLYIIPDGSVKKALLLASFKEKFTFFILRPSPKFIDRIYRLFSCVHVLYIYDIGMSLGSLIESKNKEDHIPYLFLSKSLNPKSLDHLLEGTDVLYVTMKSPSKRDLTKVIVSFSERA